MEPGAGLKWEQLAALPVLDPDQQCVGSVWNCAICGRLENSGYRCLGCSRVNFQWPRTNGSVSVTQPEKSEDSVDFSLLPVENVDADCTSRVWMCAVCRCANINRRQFRCSACGRVNFQLCRVAAERQSESPLFPPSLSPSPAILVIDMPISPAEPPPKVIDFASLPLLPCKLQDSECWTCQVCQSSDNMWNQIHCNSCNRVNFAVYELLKGDKRRGKEVLECFRMEKHCMELPNSAGKEQHGTRPLFNSALLEERKSLSLGPSQEDAADDSCCMAQRASYPISDYSSPNPQPKKDQSGKGEYGCGCPSSCPLL